MKSKIKQDFLNKCAINGIKIIGTYTNARNKIELECHCGRHFFDAPRYALISCGCIKRNTSVKWQGYGEISKTFFNTIKKGAEARDLEFEIDIEYIWHLFLRQERLCALSGMVLKFSRHPRHSIETQTASLDRIDSNLGYVKDNVQWVHKKVNRIKGNLSELEFIKWCELVALHEENT